MNYIGTYYGFETYYFDISVEDFQATLPSNNWFCCAIANKDFDNSKTSIIEKFIRVSINLGILSWHGLGKYGEKVHDSFDSVRTEMEINENHPEIDVCTVGQNESDISSDFWGCYGAACLPEQTDYDSIKLICISFDGEDYQDSLKELIKKFNDGWLPPD